MSVVRNRIAHRAKLLRGRMRGACCGLEFETINSRDADTLSGAGGGVKVCGR